MSLCAPYTTSRPVGPMGWSGQHNLLHCQPVFPTNTSSMHLNMTRNAPKRLHTKYMLNDPNGLPLALHVINKQRPDLRYFGGVQEYNAKRVNELSLRLSKYDPKRFPADSRANLPPVDTSMMCYRGNKISSTDELIKRLYSAPPGVYGVTDQDKGKGRIGKKCSNKEVEAIVDRLSKYDPGKLPADSKGKPATPRDLSDFVYPRKSASKQKVDAIVERLSQYDAQKCPADSPRKPSLKRSATFTEGKKYSSNEVDAIVDRLTTFDTKRWPAESVGTKSHYFDGTPLKFKNH